MNVQIAEAPWLDFAAAPVQLRRAQSPLSAGLPTRPLGAYSLKMIDSGIGYRVSLNPTRRHPMPTGTVKWFNPTKGYGFIQPSDGGKDVFVHISAVERAGLSTLNEGQKVSYDLQTERGKTAAANLKVAG
jgi:CspA family cold shock protein